MVQNLARVASDAAKLLVWGGLSGVRKIWKERSSAPSCSGAPVHDGRASIGVRLVLTAVDLRRKCLTAATGLRGLQPKHRPIDDALAARTEHLSIVRDSTYDAAVAIATAIFGHPSVVVSQISRVASDAANSLQREPHGQNIGGRPLDCGRSGASSPALIGAG